MHHLLIIQIIKANGNPGGFPTHTFLKIKILSG
jgi:hypothetical protein